MSERAQPEVVDEPDAHRFTATVDGQVAELRYRRDDGRVVLLHTEVPEELEGRGIAGALVRTAVARAAEEDVTVAPWCPYARSWLEKHPDEAATVEIDWSPPPSR